MKDKAELLKNKIDVTKEILCGLYFLFDKDEPNALIKTIEEALKLYENKERFKEINIHNMSCDFSWDVSAKAYDSLYKSLLENKI